MRRGLLGLVVVPSVACGGGSNSLFRGAAATLVSKRAEWKSWKQTLPVSYEGQTKLHDAGYLNMYGFINAKGKKAFAGYSGWCNAYGCIEPKAPVDIKVSVTGIADMGGPDSDEIDFAWAYRNLPSSVRPFVVTGGSGKAYARLYDDGFRIDSIEVDARMQAGGQ